MNMKRILSIPIRLKLMVMLLLVVTTAVGVITFTMASLFHQDRRTYIHDLASVAVLSTAEECRSLLTGYVERLRAYARILDKPDITPRQKTVLLNEFFEDFPDLVAVTLFLDGEEIASVYDARTLEAAGLSKEETAGNRARNSIPQGKIESDYAVVENSTMTADLPTMTLTTALDIGGSGDRSFLSAIVRLDSLRRLSTRTGVFEIFLLDSNGVYLAHTIEDLVTRRGVFDLPPGIESIHGEHSASMTLEHVDNDMEMISGFAGVEVGKVTAVARIPKSAAYIASRDLRRTLLGVALILLLISAVVGLAAARRLTRPIEHLSEATRKIGMGNFDIKVGVESWDEIGALAHSFNRMGAELRNRESRLKEAHEQVLQSEKMAAFGQLGAGIAHEIKNPMSGILGFAQVSLKNAVQGTTLHKHLAIIERESIRCRDIINNLLMFARREKTEKEPMSINEVIDRTCQLMDYQFRQKDVALEKDLDAEDPALMGNANQLQQVFTNLLINALQAMNGSGSRVVVRTGRPDSGGVEIRVSDDGPGIPQEYQDRLFEPFFTTKPGGKGTGLGLSVSFGIIRDHNGTIEVKSELGRGAEFIITLPKDPGPESVPATDGETEQAGHPA
jgi:signal transduction histidine kinase